MDTGKRPQITIRPLHPDDVTRLVQIYNHAVLNTIATFDLDEASPSFFDRFVDPSDHAHRLVVAVVAAAVDPTHPDAGEGNGVVAGYAGVCSFSPRRGYDQLGEVLVYVGPEFQKMGVGTALLRHLHDPSLRFLDGLHTTVTKICKENEHSWRMFERLGYEFRGELVGVGWKFGKRWSVVIHQRDVPRRSGGEETAMQS